ncbi:hypothetical protein [Streptomyces sp. CRN 30]|uniref:hypothetical protein n=1 Tax=Streptomyces sp. CRN 30 TaxID=3075613 RepID=UPI002A82516D|nr:hypothetical protein [Streptomyces sp. CRN 30]
MTMVGLFWITDDHVYVGAEPVGAGPGVRLGKDGVEAVGSGQGAFWGWDEVRGLDVRDVAVRSGARRLASLAFDALVVLATGDGEQPPAFTVAIESDGGAVEVSALAAVHGGIHTPDEYELSRTLLGRFADGTADVSALLAWRRDRSAEDAEPGRKEQEELLRGWCEG